jgi:hypothetical protein
MRSPNELFTPPLADRAMLALTRLEMVYEQRDGFFSDDDVLDAICEFTTEDLTVDAPPAEWGDYRCLSDAVWMAIEVADSES